MTLLVTGRILGELQKVAGQLHFVDGVVAENGAVLHFPDSGHTSVLAPPTSDAFLDELRRRGIVHTAGQCLVDTDASEAPRLLQVIHKLELPLVLVFNGRLISRNEVGLAGLLKFETCEVTVTGDRATAVCGSVRPRSSAPERIDRTFMLERVRRRLGNQIDRRELRAGDGAVARPEVFGRA